MQEQLSRIYSQFQGNAQELIPILQKVQEEFGYLPKEAMDSVAGFAGVPVSKAYGVATFYTMFRFKPIGKKHVCVCRGTACHVRGADQILDQAKRELNVEEGDTTDDGEYSLETVACVGCCALAPVVVINGKVSGRLTPQKIGRTLKEGQ